MPKVPCQKDDDWASVVHGPCRGYRELDVNVSYGMTATDEVEWGPRKFVFVQTCDDYKQEFARLPAFYGGGNVPEKEDDAALAKPGTSPMGPATPTILKSKVSPSGELIEGKDYGKLDYLKFRLDIDSPKRKPRSPR